MPKSKAGKFTLGFDQMLDKLVNAKFSSLEKFPITRFLARKSWLSPLETKCVKFDRTGGISMYVACVHCCEVYLPNHPWSRGNSNFFPSSYAEVWSDWDSNPINVRLECCSFECQQSSNTYLLACGKRKIRAKWQLISVRLIDPPRFLCKLGTH
jgi:hypothetical protein